MPHNRQEIIYELERLVRIYDHRSLNYRSLAEKYDVMYDTYVSRSTTYRMVRDELMEVLSRIRS